MDQETIGKLIPLAVCGVGILWFVLLRAAFIEIRTNRDKNRPLIRPKELRQ